MGNIYENRVLAYQIYEKLKGKQKGKRLSLDGLESINIIKPSEDKKVILGVLKKISNISEEELKEILTNYNLDYQTIYKIIEEFEELVDDFFIKQLKELKNDNAPDIDFNNLLEKENNINKIESYFSKNELVDLISNKYEKSKNSDDEEMNLLLNINNIITFYKKSLYTDISFEKFEEILLENYFQEKIIVDNSIYYIINDTLSEIIEMNEIIKKEQEENIEGLENEEE